MLVAEEQTAGRGRLGRSWSSMPGASLTFSVLLRPAGVPAARRGWLPLLAGVAVASAVRSVASVDAVLKWPNDVLVGDRKLAGILAEQSPDGSAVVIGTGLNVAAPAGALPVSAAGLPDVAAAPRARRRPRGPAARDTRPARALVRGVPRRPGPGAVRPARRLPRAVRDARPKVRVELPAGGAVTGAARDIDADGRLLVAEGSGDRSRPSRPATSSTSVRGVTGSRISRDQPVSLSIELGTAAAASRVGRDVPGDAAGETHCPPLIPVHVGRRGLHRDRYGAVCVIARAAGPVVVDLGRPGVPAAAGVLEDGVEVRAVDRAPKSRGMGTADGLPATDRLGTGTRWILTAWQPYDVPHGS